MNHECVCRTDPATPGQLKRKSTVVLLCLPQCQVWANPLDFERRHFDKTNKNQGAQAMAWKKMWTYLEVIRAIRSYLEPCGAH